MIWDTKIQEPTEETRKAVEDTSSDEGQDLFKYREYKESDTECEEGEEKLTPLIEVFITLLFFILIQVLMSLLTVLDTNTTT